MCTPGADFVDRVSALADSGDKPFAVIDTESRRALHYADQFRVEHAELRAPFRPDAYADAIVAALVPLLRPNDVVAIFSNGGFGGIHAKLLSALQAR